MRWSMGVALLVLIGFAMNAIHSTSAQTDYSESYRPQCHFSAQSGWLGDPNGMVRYNGTYHVFWWGQMVRSIISPVRSWWTSRIRLDSRRATKRR